MTTTTTAIDTFLATLRGDHRDEPWSDTAVLDAVVPGWRFTREGGAGLGAQFRAWFPDPGSLEEVRRLRTAAGEVIELTVTRTENGVPHAARQVHVVDLADDGRIARDEMWCGGRWPAGLLAQMEAARDAC